MAFRPPIALRVAVFHGLALDHVSAVAPALLEALARLTGAWLAAEAAVRAFLLRLVSASHGKWRREH